MTRSVFISYSHDTDAHKARVLEVARSLLEAGWDVRLDRYSGHPAEGWPRWMARQVRSADVVVCVCTPTYRRRFDGEEKSGGLGVSWEGHLITADLYSSRGGAPRYLPAYVDSNLDVPLALRPRAIAFGAVVAHLGTAGDPRPEPPIGGGADGAPLYAPVRGLFRTLPMQDGQYAPSDLLRPEFGVVGHVPRPGVDDVLDAWCGGAGVRVGLMTGGGGAGKTRSALELALRRRAEGWRVGPLVESEPSDEALQSLFDDPIPLLLIVDYAELRVPQVARVLQQLDRAVETAREPLVVRVLLLARSKGKWWDNLAEAAECLERYTRGPELRVPHLASHPFGRHAAEQYAGLLRTRVPAVVPEDGATPLERQVDALLAVYGDVGRGLDRLLRHEDKFILNAATRKVGNAELLPGSVAALLPRALALLTLVGGVGEDAREWLAAIPGLRGLGEDQREAVLDVLRRLYPDREGGIAPLRPDRLGERLVFREVREDPRAELLTLAVDRGRGRQALTVLTRLAQAARDAERSEEAEPLILIVRIRLTTTALDALDVGIQTGDPIGRILAAEVERSPDIVLIRQLSAALPDSSVALCELAEVCTRHLAEREEDPVARAHHLNNLSVRLADLGRREDALAASEEAVQLYRTLARQRPDAFLPGLAMSLNNLSNALADLGRREDALAAIDEAVQVRRALARKWPDAFLCDLAAALTNLSPSLADLGRREDALAASQEAVQLYRTLARERPDAFLPDLAGSLNNLSVMLANIGRREDALAASEEAVLVYGALAREQPDAFLPDLALSRSNLSNRLANLGRREDALAACKEAVQLYRTLARQRPDAFLPGLAMSLNNLSNGLADLGRREDALAAIDEAVQARRALARERPDAFLPELAGSLDNLSGRLTDLGRREDALAASQEAVQLYRTLAREQPEAFLPDLASSLNSLSVMLANLGRREDALAAIDEAVQVRRALARQRPDAFLPDLALSLNNLSVMLENLGRHEDALAASKEAVQLYRTLARERPDAFLPDLAGSLNNLCGSLANLGRREDALAAIDEAVLVHRALARERPDAFLPDLATSLNNLSVMLTDLGRREDALAASEEAVQLYRTLARQRPDAFLPGLAMSLNNLSNALADLGRREDALAAIDEAVLVHRALARKRADAFLPDLARSLEARAWLAVDVPDPGGVEAGAESISLLVPLARTWPGVFAERLDACRRNYARACLAAGRVPEPSLLAD